jgi:hypothetical protein
MEITYLDDRYCFILNKITLCFIFTSVNTLYIFVTLYFFTGKKTHHDNSGLSLTLTVAAFWRHSVKTTFSLSLWRVVRGSKLMHLDSLIHGLFIT